MDTSVVSGAPAPLYRQLADSLAAAIASGSLAAGDRLPSVRELSARERVSIATALQTYRHLEERCLVEARPRSGYYVSAAEPPASLPAVAQTPLRPSAVRISAVLAEMRAASTGVDLAPLGAATPGHTLFPEKRLQRHTIDLIRRRPALATTYSFGPGEPELRRAIARRSVSFGCRLAPDDIVITNGAMEALTLALRAVAHAGDVIAVESPTYFGVLEIIESLGMKALEVPASPRDGISLAALEIALDREPVRACVVIPNFHNPLGSVMPDEAKEQLVAMLAERDVPLIEDDVYGEVCFGAHRPPVCKRWDRTGNVILCSSFSKTLAPGFRVGWIAAGRHSERVAALRFINSSATPPLTQAVVAAFLRDGGYDRHLRALRAAFAIQVANVARSVRRHFPAGCRFALPQGGLVLWVELPRGTNSRELFRRALGESISIAPGFMFTTSRRFDHYVRLNCGHPWSPALDAALQRLGRLVAESSGQ